MTSTTLIPRKFLLICSLLVILTASGHRVKRIEFPVGSRTTKAMVRGGLVHHILPRFRNGRTALQKFATVKAARLTAVGDKIDKKERQLVERKQKVTEVTRRREILQKECNTTVKNLCTPCVASACARRERDICRRPVRGGITLVLRRFVNLCSCPLYFPHCSIERHWCRSTDLPFPSMRNVHVDDDAFDAGDSFKDFDVENTINFIAEKLVDSSGHSAAREPDVVIDGIAKSLSNDWLDTVGRDVERTEEVLSDNVLDAIETLGDESDDIIGENFGEKLEEFVVDAVDDFGDLDYPGYSLGDLTDDIAVSDVTDSMDEYEFLDDVIVGGGDVVGEIDGRDRLHDFRYDVRRRRPDVRDWSRYEKRSIAEEQDLERRQRYVHTDVYKHRVSVREPSCHELKRNPTEACKGYQYHDVCKKQCDPKQVCHSLASVEETLDLLLQSYKWIHEAYKRANVAYTLTKKHYEKLLDERKRAFCWGIMLKEHYKFKQSKGWYDITKVNAYYDQLTRKYLNVTVAVDIGSGDHRYKGNIVFLEGFNPITNEGVKKTAAEAVAWYKMKLTQNSACNSG